MNSDPNFLICRKFGRLHVQVLLHLQDEIAELEEELEDLDKADYKDDYRRLVSRRRDDELSGERRELLQKISTKLVEYGNYPTIGNHVLTYRTIGDLIFRLQKLDAVRRPTERNQTSVYNIISKTGVQAMDESGWIRRGPDLAAIAHDAEYGWLNGLVETALMKFSRTLTKVSLSQTSSSRLPAVFPVAHTIILDSATWFFTLP